MSSKISTYLNFAIRSNSLLKGIDNILKINPKKIDLVVVLDKNISQSTDKKIREYCEQKNIPIIYYYEEIKALEGVKVVAILDKNLADAILKENKQI